jgi:hypothetical protein
MHARFGLGLRDWDDYGQLHGQRFIGQSGKLLVHSHRSRYAAAGDNLLGQQGQVNRSEPVLGGCQLYNDGDG